MGAWYTGAKERRMHHVRLSAPQPAGVPSAGAYSPGRGASNGIRPVQAAQRRQPPADLLAAVHCEACGTELAGIVEMTPPAVAHHLRLLRSSHLLVSRREGKEVYYRAADTAQAQALHHMIEEMVEISCPRDGGR